MITTIERTFVCLRPVFAFYYFVLYPFNPFGVKLNINKVLTGYWDDT